VTARERCAVAGAGFRLRRPFEGQRSGWLTLHRPYLSASTGIVLRDPAMPPLAHPHRCQLPARDRYGLEIVGGMNPAAHGGRACGVIPPIRHAVNIARNPA
jgi:hypothetical protein